MLKSLKRTIIYIYRISPKYFILNLILILMCGISSGLSLYSTKLLINNITNINVAQDNFIKTIVIFTFINITILLISKSSSIINLKHQLIIDNKMSLDILNKCVDLELRDFEDSEIYDMLGRAQMEGQVKVYLIYSNIMDVLMQITSLISVISILLTLNSKIFVIVIVIPVISIYLNYRIGKRNYNIKMARVKNIRETTYINYLLSNDVGYKEMKIFNSGQYLLSIYSGIKNKILSQDFRMIKERTIIDVFLGIADESVGLFVVFYIANMAIKGDILIGSMVAYIDSIGMIQSNLNTFLNKIPEIYNNMLYVNRYFDFLNYGNSKGDNESKIVIDKIDRIEFKNFSYKYRGKDRYVLQNINLTLNIGEFTVIVGENGSGKTTFIKILCGFYDDYSGEILINGINLKDINIELLRNKISAVFQDYNKYEFTMRKNIGIANIERMSEDELIYSSLEEVGLKGKVEEYKNEIDTQMGLWFDGEQLSIGQWQKVAIARALIRNYDLIILDEPTSALDANSERKILETLKTRSSNSMSIYITHRINNIKFLNPRVLVFKCGEIVGDGAHDDLRINCSEYQLLLDKHN